LVNSGSGACAGYEKKRTQLEFDDPQHLIHCATGEMR
jgi:hypothetical protein